MSSAIAGMGWVTPLGSGLSEVWDRLVRGEEASATPISEPASECSYPVFRVPADALRDLPAHPRLRRSGAISRFAAAAGLGALRDAGLTITPENAPRVAIIFAISNGGVVYTKRFYHDIVASGAKAASPLLFPETVFNAPASHLAAILGIGGSSYTLVGDGSVGAQAIAMANDLLVNGEFEYCLVVAAEEADWLLCDAYAKWRLLRDQPPLEPFQKPARGTVLSEGAGAILLARSGKIRVEQAHPGAFFANRRQLAPLLTKLLRDLEASDQTNVIASANGTFIDRAEAAAIKEVSPGARVYTVKPALGESIGASGLWQTIAAAESLATGQLPPLLHSSRESHSAGPASSAIVLNCGLNQQVAGLRLAI